MSTGAGSTTPRDGRMIAIGIATMAAIAGGTGTGIIATVITTAVVTMTGIITATTTITIDRVVVR